MKKIIFGLALSTILCAFYDVGAMKRKKVTKRTSDVQMRNKFLKWYGLEVLKERLDRIVIGYNQSKPSYEKSDLWRRLNSPNKNEKNQDREFYEVATMLRGLSHVNTQLKKTLSFDFSQLKKFMDCAAFLSKEKPYMAGDGFEQFWNEVEKIKDSYAPNKNVYTEQLFSILWRKRDTFHGTDNQECWWTLKDFVSSKIKEKQENLIKPLGIFIDNTSPFGPEKSKRRISNLFCEKCCGCIQGQLKGAKSSETENISFFRTLKKCAQMQKGKNVTKKREIQKGGANTKIRKKQR